MKNFKKYENNFDEITTFNSFFFQPTLISKRLIFPYFNIGISNHELNPIDEILHIDYCYIVIEDAIQFTSDAIEKIDKDIIYLGGVNIETNKHLELSYYCSKKYLVIPDNFCVKKYNPYNLQDSFWYPIDTSNHKKNILSNKIEFIKQVNENFGDSNLGI